MCDERTYPFPNIYYVDGNNSITRYIPDVIDYYVGIKTN